MRTLCLLALLLLLPSLLLPPAAEGSWRIFPIRLELDPRVRSGVITVVNSGEEVRHFAVEVLAWNQNEDGSDQYTPTEEVVFFPRRLSVPAGEERVVRAGVRVPPADRERAYRLFIREEAPPREDGMTGVAIVLRFGVPIFVRPAVTEVRGELAAEVRGGELRLAVANKGNVHFRIQSVSLSGRDEGGEELFADQLGGGTILSGAIRSYSAALPPEICSRLHTVAIEVDSDPAGLQETVIVDEASCLRE